MFHDLRSSNGQLGISSGSSVEWKPVLIKSLQGVPISHIVCGRNHSFAVSRSGIERIQQLLKGKQPDLTSYLFQ